MFSVTQTDQIAPFDTKSVQVRNTFCVYKTCSACLFQVQEVVMRVGFRYLASLERGETREQAMQHLMEVCATGPLLCC